MQLLFEVVAICNIRNRVYLHARDSHMLLDTCGGDSNTSVEVWTSGVHPTTFLQTAHIHFNTLHLHLSHRLVQFLASVSCRSFASVYSNYAGSQ